MKQESDLLVPNTSIIHTNRILEFEGMLLMLKIICLPVNKLRTRDLGRRIHGTGEPDLHPTSADPQSHGVSTRLNVSKR